MDIDLSALTLEQVFGLLVVITAFDVVGSILAAIVQGKFNAAFVALWVQSHVLKRQFPIFALAVIGHGIPQLGVPAIEPAYLAALAGLAAYVVETIKSLMDSVRGGDPPPPADTTPVPAP